MDSGAIRPPSAAAAPPQTQLTAEEEALKRNTDCVYFLASPLTCKKGSECEYRHSEAARINPRDCYYWLNSNCTNRKCTFRHPPLEGIFGVMPTPPVLPVATGYNPTKQNTPCYYFQKGNCIKGDRCPFMHGPPSSGTNTIPQQPAKVSASPTVPSLGTRRTEPVNPSAIAKPAQNTSYNGNDTQARQGNPVPNVSKAAVNSRGPNGPATAATKPRAASTVNDAHHLPNKTVPAVNSLDGDPRYPHPMGRGSTVQNHEMSDERPQDSKEGDEFLGESSPGFDVIVDHDEEDSGYLPPNEEDYRRAFGDSYNRAEMYPMDDYELMSRYERERQGVVSEHEYVPEFDRESDRFGYKGNDQYDRKRRRDSSSERALDRPIRRQSHREETGMGAETGINGSDLRHRLLNKQRRLNGSRPRSDVSPDKRDEGHHRHQHRREERNLEDQDRYSSRGMDRIDPPLDRGAVHGRSRLQGRIKMPLRPAERSNFMHDDIEMERRGHLRGSARVSPAPVDFSSRRPIDRTGQWSSSREVVGRLAPRRDDVSFSGPKSLSELKGTKATDRDSDGGVKETAVDFDGPMPLSEILRRKREAAGMARAKGSSEKKSSNDGASLKAPSTDASPCEPEIEEGMISDVNDTHNMVQVTSKVDGSDEKEFEDQEEPYDETRREDPNYYEGEEGEEYQMEDENAYQEEGEEGNEYPEGEEDFEDDDEQAFARKVGVVLS